MAVRVGHAPFAVMRWLYSLLMWLAQPLLRRKLCRRGAQEAGYLHAIDERFGHYTQAVAPHNGPTVWVHAVSLGETRAAAVLIAALRAQWPSMRLLLTHGTATGRAEGQKLLQPGDLQTWQPWDAPGAAQRFLAHFQPDLGVLMETEIWPNLVHLCRRQGVPLVLVNARLSDKSLRQAQRLAWLARPAYAGLAAVWAQTAADAERLTQLGAPVRGVLGNLKFDATPDQTQLALGRQWRLGVGRPVVMLASSREGEELALLQILKEFWPLADMNQPLVATKSIVNQVLWLIVPRHPQRFEAVAELIQSQGFAVSRRCQWSPEGPGAMPQGPTIWLGDSLGEMALYYGLADVALLGGSFEPLGGQNLIEAAACGCPVVMGPHTFNFAEAAEQALAAGAALRTINLQQAVTVASALPFDNDELSKTRLAAGQFAQAHQGAAIRQAAALNHYLVGF
ncbi:3-deoxy-D-manno-octulosonic acid transferase [Rhodoferax sp.]|uniref:3-deoxy-D-manno-octulosonic acid transferase n=1 Tax=Rhodoferax sp. TaxID=50421 RepID=UPI002629A92A|nr:3-deoxy-D-manno-octulosonic acid transferase [Rhodoferax sp.]MDD2924295.1 3-deoxy-D-manno-octulosonic acid transferase [Rhodoferax sp.]